MKQVTIHVRVTEEQEAALEEIKRQHGTPYSETVRRALDAYFLEEKKKWKDGALVLPNAQ